MLFKIYTKNCLDKSGNNTTAIRLSKILNLPKTNFIQNDIVGIHAYKFGKDIIKKNFNFILIIGGTDIYIDINFKEKKKIILQTLIEAKYIVVFNSYIYNRIISICPNISKKIKIIKQSVPNLIINNLNLRHKYNITTEKIFLLIGNIRYVKNIDFILNFSKKFNLSKKSTFVVIGKFLDKKYIFPNDILHINGIDRTHVYSYLKQADGLINTSLNEGMSSSILEAMKLKCPVYAKKNEGNCSIISDGFNGFIFEDYNELFRKLKYKTNFITEFAYNYVSFFHNPYFERKSYQKLLSK